MVNDRQKKSKEKMKKVMKRYYKKSIKLTVKEIAEKSGVSERTVQKYRQDVTEEISYDEIEEKIRIRVKSPKMRDCLSYYHRKSLLKLNEEHDLDYHLGYLKFLYKVLNEY